MHQNIACLHHVWVKYNDVVALEDVNLCLHAGDFVSVID